MTLTKLLKLTVLSLYLWLGAAAAVNMALAQGTVAYNPVMRYKGAWSTGTAYLISDTVTSVGVTYVSLVANNLGNTPATSPSQWAVVGTNSGLAPMGSVLIVEGDSTSSPTGNGQLTSTQSWPYLLSQKPFFANSAFHNFAVAGSTCASMTARYATGPHLYRPAAGYTKSYLTPMIGRNDLGLSPATEEACIDAYVATAVADGFTVIPMTILPSSQNAIGPVGNALNITSVSQTLTGGPYPAGSGVATITGTGFTATAGQAIYFPPSVSGYIGISNGFSTAATVTSPTCATSTIAQTTATNVHIVCAGSTTGFTVGQPVLIGITDGGLTGAGAFLNNNYLFVNAQSGNSIDLTVAGTTFGTTAITGNIYNSTGVGYPLNGNILTVLASPAPTSTSLSFATGYEFPYSNTASAATAYMTTYANWDSISNANELNRIAINEHIRVTYPGTMDSAQLLSSCDDLNYCVDGTHQTVAFSAAMASAVANWFNNPSSLPSQPLGNFGSPQLPGPISSLGSYINGNNSLLITGPNIHMYVGPNSSGWIDFLNGANLTLPAQYSALSHSFNVGRTPYLTISSSGVALPLLSSGCLQTGVGSLVTNTVMPCGSVTSVAITVPAPLTPTGCTITSSGTCAITWAGGQTANQFLATPPNGTTGPVGLRAIVAADIPTLNYQTPITLTTTGTSGASTLSGGTLNIPQYSGGGGTVPGIVYADGTTYTTIAAAVTQACTFTPAYAVTIPASSTIALTSTIDDTTRFCSSGAPVFVTDLRKGENYSSWAKNWHINDHRMTLRQTIPKYEGIEITGSGNLTHLVIGDSTGWFPYVNMDQRIAAEIPGGVAGYYSIPGAGSWGGAVQGNSVFVAFPGATASNTLGSISATGDCGANTGYDYTRTPWGVYYALGLSTNSLCTFVYSLLNENGDGSLKPMDTAKIWYVTEPGAGSLTYSVGDGTNSLPATTVSASAGSIGVGFVSVSGVGTFNHLTLTNSGNVKIIALGGECSTCNGLKMLLFNKGGSGIDGMFGIYPLSLLQSIFSHFPSIDLVTSNWKNNDALTPAQYGTYLQDLYTLVQPYGTNYNASTAPNPVDVVFSGNYLDGNVANATQLDLSSAARQVAESNQNAYFEDLSFDELSYNNNNSLTYSDEVARCLYCINGSGTIHFGNIGQRYLGDKVWHDFGFDAVGTRTVANSLTLSDGSQTQPSNNFYTHPGLGDYYDSTHNSKATAGGLVVYGGFSSLSPGNYSALTVTSSVPGSTSYSYEACAQDVYQLYRCTPVATITNGNSSLSTGPNSISIPFLPGGQVITLYRTVGGSSQGQIYSAYGTSGQTVVVLDNGLTASGSLPPASSTNAVAFGAGGFTPTESYPTGIGTGKSNTGYHGYNPYYTGIRTESCDTAGPVCDYEISTGGKVERTLGQQGSTYTLDEPCSTGTNCSGGVGILLRSGNNGVRNGLSWGNSSSYVPYNDANEIPTSSVVCQNSGASGLNCPPAVELLNSTSTYGSAATLSPTTSIITVSNTLTNVSSMIPPTGIVNECVDILANSGGWSTVAGTSANNFANAITTVTGQTYRACLTSDNLWHIGPVSGAAPTANPVFTGTATLPSVNQPAANTLGGACTMASSTSCTITLAHTYASPVCIVTQQSSTLTGGAVGCTVSGIIVTITAATANSETWGAFVFGNPN